MKAYSKYNQKHFLHLFVLSAISLFGLTKAQAWGDLGHETVGEIAERLISKDAKMKLAVQSILGVEPLALSAVWPDKVRSDERYNDFANYHFMTEFVNPDTVVEKDAMTVLEKYPNVLVNKTAPVAAKMIALKFIIHVVGDIHQPLHVGNEFDRGGNYCQILWQPDLKKPATSVNLHAAWDTQLVEHIAGRIKSELATPVKYFGYKHMTDSLMVKYKDLIESTLKEKVDVRKWVKESSDLRKTKAYPDQLAENARPYCKDKVADIEPAAIPVLNISFIDERALIAEQRIVLAGVRLAAYLTEVMKTSKSHQPLETDILNMLKLTNHNHH